MNQNVVQQNIDVMLLQETHFTESIINTITKQFHDWGIIRSLGKSNSCGCSTFINRKYKILNNVVGESGRLLLTNIEISDTVFCHCLHVQCMLQMMIVTEIYSLTLHITPFIKTLFV